MAASDSKPPALRPLWAERDTAGGLAPGPGRSRRLGLALLAELARHDAEVLDESRVVRAAGLLVGGAQDRGRVHRRRRHRREVGLHQLASPLRDAEVAAEQRLSRRRTEAD